MGQLPDVSFYYLFSISIDVEEQILLSILRLSLTQYLLTCCITSAYSHRYSVDTFFAVATVIPTLSSFLIHVYERQLPARACMSYQSSSSRHHNRSVNTPKASPPTFSTNTLCSVSNAAKCSAIFSPLWRSFSITSHVHPSPSFPPAPPSLS